MTRNIYIQKHEKTFKLIVECSSEMQYGTCGGDICVTAWGAHVKCVDKTGNPE